jgi:hypothetical protein
VMISLSWPAGRKEPGRWPVTAAPPRAGLPAAFVNRAASALGDSLRSAVGVVERDPSAVNEASTTQDISLAGLPTQRRTMDLKLMPDFAV